MPLTRIINLLVCVSILCSVAAYAQKDSKTNRPIEVIVQPVAIRELQNNIEALGNLYANESTVITAKTTKVITKINFDDGQIVSKGAVLVEMLNVEEEALMNEARLTAGEAKKQLTRAQALKKSGAVSASTLDQLTSDYATAQARFNALQSRYQDTFITAPFDGVVGIRNVSVGGLVSPGQIITTLNDDSKMKLDFTVPAIYLRSLRKGLPVEAQSYDLGKTFKGEIVSIDNQVDPATRAIKVRAILKNKAHQLKQGLSLSVTLQADRRKAMVISEAALVPLGSDNFVFVARENSASSAKAWFVERRKVEIGQRYEGLVEILNGVNESEKIVTHGLQKINAGQEVTILAEETNDPLQKRKSLSELLQQNNKEHP